jgi:hypothetical protein
MRLCLFHFCGLEGVPHILKDCITGTAEEICHLYETTYEDVICETTTTESDDPPLSSSTPISSSSDSAVSSTESSTDSSTVALLFYGFIN